jgi:hypothetical protein
LWSKPPEKAREELDYNESVKTRKAMRRTNEIDKIVAGDGAAAEPRNEV